MAKVITEVCPRQYDRSFLVLIVKFELETDPSVLQALQIPPVHHRQKDSEAVELPMDGCGWSSGTAGVSEVSTADLNHQANQERLSFIHSQVCLVVPNFLPSLTVGVCRSPARSLTMTRWLEGRWRHRSLPRTRQGRRQSEGEQRGRETTGLVRAAVIAL